MNATQIVETVVMGAAGHPAQERLDTPIPRLSIWHSPTPTKPAPALFEPKFYVLLQGAKRLTIAGDVLYFAAGSYAVSCVALPFTSQILEASRERPYFDVELRLDAGLVGSLLTDVPDPGAGEAGAPSFASAQGATDVMEAFSRLVRLLTRPEDIPVLAASLERELYYRLLQSPVGGTLRQIVHCHRRFRQIRTAAEWLAANAATPERVAEIAARVGMSVTSFHRHFKAVTAYSPLAYQQHLRLLEARRLLASGAANVTSAAFATGYASASQFSREYKHTFGVPPKHDAPARLR